ncbi:hypothetical protein [Leifsonia sp. Leaf336]|uniref:hypothetical protein n=1 Tax=Leifsonia sp. Leaf336 TaxID=1736341 RepID=UPI000AEECFCD|nr:hypothetical protein [Leifsonia sp. Leaf336]
MKPNPVKVAVLRFQFAPGGKTDGEEPSLTWPDELFYELFQGSNGWSVRDYWLRSSLGLLQLEFDFSIGKWWRLGDISRSSTAPNGKLLKDDRGQLYAAIRSFLNKEDVSLDGFDQVIAFVHPPPVDAGATPGGAVFDQGGIIGFYEHELGHVLGFQHSFGPFIPPPNVFGSLYNDPYCVMGYTQPQSPVDVPAEFAQTQVLDPNFWWSERRAAAASLYRRFRGTPFFEDSGWVTHSSIGERTWVGALTDFSNTSAQATPIVSVLSAPDAPNISLTVEYRAPSGAAHDDDRGLMPAVVIHSLGAHDVGAGRSEVDPAWFEAALDPQVGASVTVLGTRFEVMTVDTGSPRGVEVQTSRSLDVPFSPDHLSKHHGIADR